MNITKTRAVTYQGRRAEVHEVRAAGSKGERVNVTRWIDAATEDNGGYAAGTVVLHHCKGDGRDGTFESFSTRTADDATGVDAQAAALLAGVSR